MGAGTRAATHLGGHARAGAARRGGDGCAWLDHPIAAAGPALTAGAVLRPRSRAGSRPGEEGPREQEHHARPQE